MEYLLVFPLKLTKVHQESTNIYKSFLGDNRGRKEDKLREFDPLINSLDPSNHCKCRKSCKQSSQ